MIGENGALIVGKREEGVETIVEHIGILGVFIKNKTRDFEVANFRIENSRFTENVDTFDLIGVFEQFVEGVIGGKTKRIVDVEN